jgi:uncharacterized protein (DUF3820 family)
MSTNTTKSGPNVVPFGKYKGREILEVLEADPGYLQWLAGQDWFRAKYISLHQTIINRGAEPEETPEHNALQVLFLDDEFCQRFREVVFPDAAVIKEFERLQQDIAGNINWRIKSKLAWGYRENDPINSALEKFCNSLTTPVTSFSTKFTREFEVGGIDVDLHMTAKSNDPAHQQIFEGPRSSGTIESHGPLPTVQRQWCIEIKPAVSDDYPAVLRQMRRTNSKVLLLKSYTGQGATREQFIKTFEAAGLQVVFLEQCS